MAIRFVGEQRIKEIVLIILNVWIRGVGKKRRERPGSLRVFLLVVEQRPNGLGALPGIQCQRKLIVKQPGMKCVFGKTGVGKSKNQNQDKQTRAAEYFSKSV